MDTQDNNVEHELLEGQDDLVGLEVIEKALKTIEEIDNDTSKEEEKAELKSKEEAAGKIEEEEIEAQPEAGKETREDKLWKIKREKYRALTLLAEKEHENENLKQMLNQSLNSGTYHYERSALAELERAKEFKRKAVEDGDINALIEADININNALSAINEVKKYGPAEEQRRQPQYSAQTNKPGLTPIEEEMVSDWLDGHTYLQPASKDYDPGIAEKVTGYIQRLDADLARQGQTNMYFSEPYFAAIEKYIGNVKGRSVKTPKSNESLGHVGGVRNSYSSSTGQPQSRGKEITLTADEKRMAANAGISEKEWLKYKLEGLRR